MAKKKSRKKEDQRSESRLELEVKIKYRVVGHDQYFEDMLKIDISGGGIGMPVKEPVNVDDKIEIHIFPDNEPEPIETLGQVVWCRDVNGVLRAGMKLVDIRENFRLAGFLCDKMIEMHVDE